MREFLHPYELPMVGGTRRLGVLVRHVGEDGSEGWGDAAPLKGWSAETVDDVMGLRDVPSLRCGREAAEAGVRGFDGWPLIHSKVPMNALLDGDPAAMDERFRTAMDAGCECFKIKTAGLSIGALVEMLDKLCGIAGSRARFRLDPNRGWGFEEAVETANALAGYPIEYVEEPLVLASRLVEFIAVSDLPVALDETLREIGPEELQQYKGAAALVFKPTLMGGFGRAREFARVGAGLGMASVVSACFESGVGIYALGRFAASLEKCAASGLDTYSRLESDVLQPPLDLSGFSFDATQAMPLINPNVIAF